MKRLAFFVLALTPAMLTAQTPAKPKPATPAKPAAPVKLVEGPALASLSEQGRMMQSRVYGARDPQLVQLNADLNAIRAQRTQLTTESPVDLDELEALLRREEALTAQIRARNNDRLMQLLRSLSESDRTVLLRNMNAAPSKKAPATPAR